MIVSIHQPAYLPWLGYFHRIAGSDLHIVLDHVQFEKGSFTNRNRVRTPGGSCWLTVPVKTRGRFGDLRIRDIETAGDRWRARHWLTLRASYARAPCFAEHAPFFEEALARPWPRLRELAREVTGYLLAAFGIRTPLIYSSDLGVGGRKDALVLELCKAAGARVYLSGPFGRDYLHEPAFRDAGIEVRYHDFRHPVYRQAFPGFEPGMAAIDLLFNHGPRGREILIS